MALLPDLPRRRKDLSVVRRQVEDEIFYVVGDPVSHEYHRLGESEHVLLELLDGTRDLPAVASAFEIRTGLAIDREDLTEFVDSLRQEGIVETSGFDPALLLEEFRRRERAAAASRRLVSGSLAILKLLPFDPDRQLGWLAKRLRWCWSPSFCFLTGALVLVGTGLAAMKWDRLVPAYFDLMERAVARGGSGLAGTLATFYLVGGILIAIHEAAHGLTLKHYGGSVPEMGFALAYFQFPGAYTDTTSSYLLPSRFQRVMVSFSGGYTGLVLAGAACVVWWATEPAQLANEIALMVIVLGGPLTLLFNWNPLVPFDGYYMAVDILEAPNLLPSSFSYLGDLIRMKIFGAPPLNPSPPVRLRRVYAIFGGLAWIYQALWTVGVPIVVYVMISRVAGVLVGGVIAGFMTLRLARSRLGVLRRFLQVMRREGASPARWGRVSRPTAVALAAAAAALILVPALRLHVHGTGRLEPLERREVRAATPGFVTEILATEGRVVDAGQPLVRLTDPDLAARLEAMRWERDMLRAESVRSEAAGDAAAAAAKRDQWERRAADLGILKDREARLLIEAPAAGVLMATRLGDRLGTYMREGDLWGEIAGGDRLRSIVEVEEPWLGDVSRGAHVVVMQRGFPGERFEGRVIRMPGQSSPRPAVAVAGMADAAALGSRPSYGVEVEIDNRDRKLRPGMTAEIRIEGPRMSVVGRATRAARKLLKGRVWW